MSSRKPALFFSLILAHAAGAGLWDGSPNYNGWLHVDWFGYLYPDGNYMIHAEHGWQYPYGASQSSLYLYDFATRSWIWTSEHTYPWIYWFGEGEDWIFYYRGAKPGNRWFYSATLRDYLHEGQLQSDTHGASIDFYYTHPEAFVPDFLLGFYADIQVEVLTGDRDAVRIEQSENLDYNTPSVTVRIFAPAGTELKITGPVSVTPNMQSGQYTNAFKEKISWSLVTRNLVAYPANAFASTTADSGDLNLTVSVNGTGLRAQVMFSNSAEFRKADDGYLGRFTGSINLTVTGE